MTSSASVCKFISYHTNRSIPDLVNHQYGICCMYSKENSQDFRLPIPDLYPREWVMLLVSSDVSFKSGGPFSRICRLSVYCWLLYRIQQILFPSLLLLDVHNDGHCWRCGHWLSVLQTAPFPVQEPFWWWKDVSGNPGYIGARFGIRYEFHFTVWGVFQEVWSFGAWAFLSLKLSFFFSCSRTDRTPLHSCICCEDVLYQALHNAG